MDNAGHSGDSDDTGVAGDAEDTDDTDDANDAQDTEDDTTDTDDAQGTEDDTTDTDDAHYAHNLHDTDPSHLGGLNALVAECRHPMHNTSCGPGQPPTWPRASLRNVDNHSKQDIVLLVMEWAAHSGVGAFKPTLPGGGDNRPAAGELRALFRKHRSPGQPADELVPRYPSGPLPEMACFDPDECQCLRYDVGDQGGGGGGSGNHEEKEQGQPSNPDAEKSAFPPPPPPPPPLLLQPARFFRSSCHPGKPRGFVPIGGARRHGGFYSSHSHWRGLLDGGVGEPAQCVWMRQHWPPRGGGGEEGSEEEGVKGRRPCLVTTYRRAVVVCDNDSSRWTTRWDRPGAVLPPTHDWFHAMGPDTYHRSRGVPKPCRDAACINYYKRPKTVECDHAQANLHKDCHH